jgi:hypothetical protein
MANQFLYGNFFATELVSGCAVGDTVLNVPPADAAKFTNFSSGYDAPFSIWDGVNPPEIVWCTANPQTGALTVLRGQEGTSAFGWSAGAQLRSSITASVLNAALAAYNTGLVLVANYLPLTGGTLTGPLTLSGLPVSALQAATKSYVDSSIGAQLPLAGGTMSGNINMGSNRILSLPAPLTGGEPATKTYVDTDFTLVSTVSEDRSGQLLTAGTGAAYTLTSNTGYSSGGSAINDGVQIAFRVHASNQAAPTLAVDGAPASPIRSQSGVALPPGKLPIGSVWIAEMRAAAPEWLILSRGTLPTLGTTGGPAAYALNTGLSIGVLQDGLEFELQINTANSGAMTLNIDSIGNVPLRPSSGVEFLSGAIAQYNILPIRFNVTTGEWLVKGAPPPPIGNTNFSYSDLTNVGLTQAEATNVLTISLTTNTGANATLSNPINIPFTDPAGGGLPQWLQITGALSIATIIGAHFGQSNASVPFVLWVALFNNGGTPQLALSLRSFLGTGGSANFYSLDEGLPVNTVAMSAGSTTGGTWYTPSGVTLTGKCFRILGRLDFPSGLATPGSYNAVPNIKLYGAGSKKPGEIVNSTSVSSTTAATTSSATFAAMANETTISYTPSNVCNLERIKTIGTAGNSAATSGLQITRASTGLGNPAQWENASGGGAQSQIVFMYTYDQAPSGSSVYSVFGKASAGTLSFPLASTGIMIEIEELQG